VEGGDARISVLICGVIVIFPPVVPTKKINGN
jgi:hypothetical protein